MSVPLYAVLILLGTAFTAPAVLEIGSGATSSGWAAVVFAAGFVTFGAGIGVAL